MTDVDAVFKKLSKFKLKNHAPCNRGPKVQSAHKKQHLHSTPSPSTSKAVSPHVVYFLLLPKKTTQYPDLQTSVMANGADNTTSNTIDLQHASADEEHLSDCNDDSISALAQQVATNLLIDDCTSTRRSGDIDDIPTVSIDEGTLKYVFVTAVSPSKLLRTFIYSRKSAQYHVNVVIDLLPTLRRRGYTDIQITGGGRMMRDDDRKAIHISGCSYGFGQADHAAAKEIVEQDERYRSYQVTW